MKKRVQNFTKIVAGCFLFYIFSAQAQGVVTSAMGTRSELKAYLDAEGKSSTDNLYVKDITFPLKVLETSEAGLVRVRMQGKDVWLDRKQIRIPPESLIVTCATVDQSKASLVASGIRGANSGCK